jgi:hypothetical protein
LDVLLYGNEEEKLKQSFELLDESGRGKVNFSDFRKIVSSFAQMWSAALGQPSKVSTSNFNYSTNKSEVYRENFPFSSQWKGLLRPCRVWNSYLIHYLYSFMREMKDNPDMLFWFSKPERAMNKRVNEYLGQHEQRQKAMREKIESLRAKFNDYQDVL